MLEQLFGSKTRVKLLKVFFHAPEQTFFVRELARELETQINAVRRELQLLIEAGLLLELEETPDRGDSHKIGSTLRKYYQLNTAALLYPELQALLLKTQGIGEQQFIQAIQEKGGNVQLLLLTGRFVGDTHCQSDMLIIGHLKEHALSRLIDDFEKEIGGEIRYTMMSEKEFFERRQLMDKFLFSLFEGKHIKVVDKLNV